MELLRAISDPTRLCILKRLEKGELCACKLPCLTCASQPNVSKHLRLLREAGLVMIRKDGRNRMYSLTKKARKILADVSKW